MMDNNQSTPGFSPHVLSQLGQASEQVSHSQRGQGRGRFPRGRNYSTQPRQAPANTHSHQGPPPSRDDFPPLGTQPVSSQAPSQPSSTPNHSNNQQPRSHYQGYQRNVDRGRGTHQAPPPRPYLAQSGYGARQYHSGAQPHSQSQPQPVDSFRRPPAPHGTLYQQNPVLPANPWATSSEQQRLFRNQVMAQVDYLNRIQQDARNKYQLKRDEQIAKETFRLRLESFFQDTLLKQYPYLDSKGVRLRCYGSLNNGFGLAGCDMDLLLTLPDGFTPTSTTLLPDSDSTSKPTAPIDDASTTGDTADPAQKENFELGLLLEGALLDSQIGARLLTKTRVPILKICESPSGELLQNLRQYRADQLKTNTASAVSQSGTESILPPPLDLKALETALKNLGDQDSAAQVPLPASPAKRIGTSIEFDGEYGIKCDVNFTNSVAIHNTRLLREYCLIDPRVAQVGVFVKCWAKIRDINTPYYGTLSSYGYVLMVLHYLMNVVKPPVIPNLQHIARDQDAWNNKTSVDLFEGKYDIRFLADREKIADYCNSLEPNRESTGNLLRGFFWYYSNHQGFNWKNDTISIRTKGGIVKKFAKGWTEAKWAGDSDKKNVRLRYLMAIEDPFETEHNIARVVGHSGIVAIRDEFRRAWNIISNIGVEGAIVEDLMKPIDSRGDLLRKDQDHHREKIKQMRRAAEAKERELKDAALKEGNQSLETGTSSDSEVPWTTGPIPTYRRTSNSKLTNRVPPSQRKPRQYGSTVRRVQEPDDEDDDGKAEAVRKGDQGSKPEAVVQEKDKITSEEQENNVPESTVTLADINYAKGLNESGFPIAWDLSNRDGRWLQWRDNKIRAGTWRGVSRPDEVALDKALPFDARRPRGSPPPNYRPPWPMKKYEMQKTGGKISYFERQNSVTNTECAPTDTTPADTAPTQTARSDIAPSITTSVNSVSNDPGPVDTASDATGSIIIALGRKESKPMPHRIIRYDTWSAGGLWLKKRDAMLHSGEFDISKLDDWHRRLHLAFPYNPKATKLEVQDMNQELKKHWKRQPRASHKNGSTNTHIKAESSPVVEEARSKEMIKQVITERKDLPWKPHHNKVSLPRCLHMATNIAAPAATEVESEFQLTTTEGSVDTMPNSAFIRSRRLAYFALQEQSAVSQEKGEAEVEEQNVETLMKQAGIDINRPRLTKKDSPIAIWASSDSEQTDARASELRKFVSQSTAPTSTESAEPTRELAVLDAQKEVQPKVPLTLCPDVPLEERPRHEDPQIIPIPQELGFKFDIRQLQDLAVIQAGGNGCARAGQQFEIEMDYEWGGGGEMGYKSSSGVQPSSSEQKNHDVYEYGRGDEEGLLDELPRIEQ